MKTFAWIAAAAALALPGFARAATYELDGMHSTVGFKVRHMMVSKVTGKFDKFSGTIGYDAKDPAATTINATIDAASINTAEPKRDEHLRGKDFFEVDKFKTLEFKSKRTVAGADGKLKVTGDLTLHGVTKEVTLDVDAPSAPVKDFYGNTKVGTSATTKISRKEFGLAFNAMLETGGAVVGDEIEITLDIEANLKPDAAVQAAPAPAKAEEKAEAPKAEEKKAEVKKGEGRKEGRKSKKGKK